MKRINETNSIPSTCSKKQVINLDEMKIDDNGMCDIIEEVHKWDKFNKRFDIGLIFEYEYDEDSSENDTDSSGESNNEEGHELW